MVESMGMAEVDFTSYMESDPFFAEFGGLLEEEDNSMIVDSNDEDKTKTDEESNIEQRNEGVTAPHKFEEEGNGSQLTFLS